MHVPVSTKAASLPVQTSSTPGILSGKAGHGTGKQGVLPGFAEIFSEQSEKAGAVEGMTQAPDQSAQGGMENMPAGKLEFAAEALHLPKVPSIKATEDAEPKTTPHPRSSFEKDKGTLTKAAKLNKTDSSQCAPDKSVAAVPQNSHLQAVSMAVVTPLPAAFLPLPTVQSVDREQHLSLSPFKPTLPANPVSPQVQSSSAQTDPTIESPADIPKTTVSALQGELHTMAETGMPPDGLGSAVREGVIAARKDSSATALSRIAESRIAEKVSALAQDQGKVSKTIPAIQASDVASPPVRAISDALAQHAAGMSKASSTAPDIPKVSHHAASAISAADTASGSHGNTSLAADVSTGIGSRNAAESETPLRSSVENKTQPAAAGNPFQRLDAGEPPSTLLHASAREVTVGVRDSSLGWIEIQTQSSAGHVTASLSAASADAHANLATEVPALTQYLADRNVHVGHIEVNLQSGSQSGSPSQSHTGHAGSDRYPQGEPSSSSGMQLPAEVIDDVTAPDPGRSSYISIRA